MKLNIPTITFNSSAEHTKLVQFQLMFERWRKMDYFGRKLSYYSKILDRVQRIQDHIQSEYFVYEVGHIPEELANYLRNPHILPKKIALLTKLVNLSLQLSHDPDENFEGLFKILEADVQPYLNEIDDFIGSYVPKTYSGKRSKEFLYVYAQIVFLLRKLYSKSYRDLRKKIRAIIRFLFKNMDDEAHLNVVVFVAQTCKTSFIQKTSSIWRRNRYSMS